LELKGKDGLESSIDKTRQQILKHHGGNGEYAREMITKSFERRHDERFWQFWDDKVAKHYQPGDGILDMGAGTGQFVQTCALRYPNSMVYGIEAAPYMLAVQVSLPNNAKIFEDDLHQPQAPIVSGSLGMVMANMVVHELTQPIKMFKAAFNWLKPGGRLCVIDVVRQPLAEYLAYRYPEVSPYDDATKLEDLEDAFEHFLEHNRYHPEDIVAMLEMGGFIIVAETPLKEGRFVKIVAEKPTE